MGDIVYWDDSSLYADYLNPRSCLYIGECLSSDRMSHMRAVIEAMPILIQEMDLLIPRIDTVSRGHEVAQSVVGSIPCLEGHRSPLVCMDLLEECPGSFLLDFATARSSESIWPQESTISTISSLPTDSMIQILLEQVTNRMDLINGRLCIPSTLSTDAK